MNLPKPELGHTNCRMCRRVNVPGCGRCHRCERCGCCCQRCSNCLKVHAWEFCGTCGLCLRPTAMPGGIGGRRCTCRSRPKAQKVSPQPRKYLRSHMLRRPVGLEIELYPTGDISRINSGSPVHLNWVRDGSVTEGGIELVVAPMVGEKLVEVLTYLGDAFRQYNSGVDATCGYHCHVGPRISGTGLPDEDDLNPYQLRRLLLLYHKFEDAFYDLVQEGRDKPHRNARGEMKCYCARLAWKPKWYAKLATLTRQRDIRRYLMEALYPSWMVPPQSGLPPAHPIHRIDMRRLRNHKYESCRYFGLNLHTWFERGTVEYRHHEGTIERERLLNWALWCGWFTEAACILTDTQVTECLTLEQLLLTRWRTGEGWFQFPSDVAAYVMQGVTSRKAAKEKTDDTTAAARR